MFKVHLWVSVSFFFVENSKLYILYGEVAKDITLCKMHSLSFSVKVRNLKKKMMQCSIAPKV